MGFIFSKSMNDSLRAQQEFMLMNSRLQQNKLGISSPLNGGKTQSCSVIDLSSVEDCKLEGDRCKNRKASDMTEVDKDPSKSQALVHAKAQSVLESL